MKLATKIITVPTIIAILVLLGAYFQTTSDDNYVLSVTWSPTALPMRQSVSITATVDGYPIISRKPRVSPFGETMTAAPGVVVTLTAQSMYPGIQKIDCMIMHNNRSVGAGAFDVRTGPGAVSCHN